MLNSIQSNLDQLRALRIKYRNHFYHKKLGQPISGGLIIIVPPEEYLRIHSEAISFFEQEGFLLKNKTAPSPSGSNNEGFEVYIMSIVDSDNYKINIGISIAIHHEDERKINFNDRNLYYY